MHKKFEINRTKFKGGCQSGRKFWHFHVFHPQEFCVKSNSRIKAYVQSVFPSRIVIIATHMSRLLVLMDIIMMRAVVTTIYIIGDLKRRIILHSTRLFIR